MSQEISSDIELFNNKLRKIGEFVERGNNRLANEGLSFIDRYLAGVLHFVIRRAPPDESEYGFVVAKWNGAGRQGGIVPLESGPNNLKIPVVGGDGEQLSMLTHDVELMKTPQIAVPSIIRLQRFNDLSWGGGKQLYEFCSLKVSSDKLGYTIGDGKIHLLSIRHAVAVGDGCGENIQTAAQDVDLCADLNVETQRKRLFLDAYYELVRSARIKVNEFYIEVEIEPGFDALFQGWELGFGPIDAGYGV